MSNCELCNTPLASTPAPVFNDVIPPRKAAPAANAKNDVIEHESSVSFIANQCFFNAAIEALNRVGIEVTSAALHEMIEKSGDDNLIKCMKAQTQIPTMAWYVLQKQFPAFRVCIWGIGNKKDFVNSCFVAFELQPLHIRWKSM